MQTSCESGSVGPSLFKPRRARIAKKLTALVNSCERIRIIHEAANGRAVCGMSPSCIFNRQLLAYCIWRKHLIARLYTAWRINCTWRKYRLSGTDPFNQSLWREAPRRYRKYTNTLLFVIDRISPRLLAQTLINDSRK